MKQNVQWSVLLILGVLLSSCGARKTVVTSKPQTKQGTVSVKKIPQVGEVKHVKKLKKASPVSLNPHTLKYIESYAPLAVKKMHEFKIPASITLAQGILESGNGRSQLASKSNNHFGIKCHKGWKGQRVYHDDDRAQECFRKYTYVEHSYNDHSRFLTTRSRYDFLFKLGTTNYKGWAKGLKKAGYATDRKYPAKLIRIIQNYKLYEFDQVKKRDLKKGRFTEEEPNVIVEKTPVVDRYHVVIKGDTLYSISRRYGLSVAKLKELNNMSDNLLSIGQKLIIQ